MIKALLLKFMSSEQLDAFIMDHVLLLLDRVIKNPSSKGRYDNILRLLRQKINLILGDQ